MKVLFIALAISRKMTLFSTGVTLNVPRVTRRTASLEAAASAATPTKLAALKEHLPGHPNLVAVGVCLTDHHGERLGFISVFVVCGEDGLRGFTFTQLNAHFIGEQGHECAAHTVGSEGSGTGGGFGHRLGVQTARYRGLTKHHHTEELVVKGVALRLCVEDEPLEAVDVHLHGLTWFLFVFHQVVPGLDRDHDVVRPVA